MGLGEIWESQSLRTDQGGSEELFDALRLRQEGMSQSLRIDQDLVVKDPMVEEVRRKISRMATPRSR